MILGVSGQTGARRLPVSLLMLTLALFGVAGWCLASRALSPSDGTTISVGDSPVSTGGVIVVAVHDPNGPFRTGDRIVSINGEQRPGFETLVWAGLVGMAHLPSAVVPVGKTAEGKPVGIQVVAPYLEDRTALDVARRLHELVGDIGAPPEPALT